MKLTAEQRIEKAHVSIMGHPATRAYAQVIMIGKTSVSDEVPTAYTNGRDKTYGREFVEKLTDAELAFVILHEAGHVVYQHGYMWKHLWKENAMLANIAADFVINLELADMAKKYSSHIQIVKGACVDEKYRGMDTQEVFNLLKKEAKDGGGGKGKSNGKGGSDAESDAQSGAGDNNPEGFDVHDFGDLTEEERKEVQAEVDNAIRQGALLAGKEGGSILKSFEDLMTPKVDWREQLRDFTTEIASGKDISTWRRPNRRWLQQDMFMPSMISETIDSVAVIYDTSGSIFCDTELLSIFTSELISLCNQVTPNVVHLICCDSDVQSHDVYDSMSYDKLASRRSFMGGGGTDMRVAVDYIDKQGIDPSAVIVLTDMYTPFPQELKRPTLWVSTTKGVTAPCGTTIYLDR